VWGGDANTQGVFSIKGNAGVVSNTAGNSYSAVLGPAVSDAEVFATGSTSAFSNSNLGTVLRWTDGNNWYKAFIDGSNLVVQKKGGGVDDDPAYGSVRGGGRDGVHDSFPGGGLDAAVPDPGRHRLHHRLPGGFGVSEENDGHEQGEAGRRRGDDARRDLPVGVRLDHNQGPGSAATAAPSAPAATPRQVTPKNVGGSPGQGPLVVSSPLPGSGHQVVLRDRTLIITSVTRRRGPAHGSVLIELNLVVRNTSGRFIKNTPAFFRLIAPKATASTTSTKAPITSTAPSAPARPVPA
jgi:hypothetical protein